MAQFGASPVTVQKAIRHLDALGVIETRPGVGTFVRAAPAPRAVDYGWQTAALGAQPLQPNDLSSTQRSAAPEAIQLHAGYPAPDLLPERLVRTALTRAARSDSAVSRATVAGLPELRAWFASQVTSASPRDTVIVPGSQSGLSSIFRALVGPGRPLIVESPTYWGAILAAHQSGVTLVPIPTGRTGPDPAELERAISTTGARAFYAQPNFANPTGTQWSSQVGREVLDVVRRHGAFLIEDDWAHDLAIDADVRPLVSQDHEGHVIYLRSLTKSVSPAIRVGAVIARGPARDRILADRAAESMYVSGLLQHAALDVVSQPAWPRHLRSMRQHLHARRDLLIRAINEGAPQVRLEHIPRGGLNLWVRLPEGTDVRRTVRECEANGLVVAPGDEWFPAEPSGAFVRLNFSAEDPARFREAGRILGHTLSALS